MHLNFCLNCVTSQMQEKEKRRTEFKERMSQLLKMFLRSSTYLFIRKYIKGKCTKIQTDHADVIFPISLLCQILYTAVFNSLKHMCGPHFRSKKSSSLFKFSTCALANRMVKARTYSCEEAFINPRACEMD